MTLLVAIVLAVLRPLGLLSRLLLLVLALPLIFTQGLFQDLQDLLVGNLLIRLELAYIQRGRCPKF